MHSLKRGDDAGNVEEIAYNSDLMVRTLGWASQYQLLAASNGTSEVESYTYDPFGRRLTTTQGTNTIVHLYDGIHCIADVDSSGDLIRSYTYGPGIDNPLAMTTYSTETNTYYYLTDHLGSVLALIDEDGQLVESYEYDAFGRIKVFDADHEDISESAYGNRITFQGREYSWATGLYYFRARWYEPVTGRWLSKDPIGISGGLNQYVGFGGCPIHLTDPHGLKLVYKGRFADRYREQVERWKETLPNDSKLRKIIEDLEASDCRHVIAPRQKPSHRPQTTSGRWIRLQEPGPSRTTIDPQSYAYDGRRWTFPEALAHELLHAHDWLTDNPRRLDPVTGGHADSFYEEEEQILQEVRRWGQ